MKLCVLIAGCVSLFGGCVLPYPHYTANALQATGHVIDTGTRQPVANATVMIRDRPKTRVTTNANGAFTTGRDVNYWPVLILLPGPQDTAFHGFVVASADGYLPAERQVTSPIGPPINYLPEVSLKEPLRLQREPRELLAARARFAQFGPHPSEQQRAAYIDRLAVLRERYADAHRTLEWQAVAAEMRRHPAPADADSHALSKLLAGEWASRRHQTIYRADGTWSLLPAEPGTTHGRWRIQGNQYFDTYGGFGKTTRYTILLLDHDDFIFTDGETVFLESRLH